MNKLPIEIINNILKYNIHPISVELKNIFKKIQEGSIFINNNNICNLNKNINYYINYKNCIFTISSKVSLNNLTFYNFKYESYNISTAILCFINKNKNNCKLPNQLINFFIKYNF